MFDITQSLIKVTILLFSRVQKCTSLGGKTETCLSRNSSKRMPAAYLREGKRPLLRNLGSTLTLLLQKLDLSEKCQQLSKDHHGAVLPKLAFETDAS